MREHVRCLIVTDFFLLTSIFCFFSHQFLDARDSDYQLIKPEIMEMVFRNTVALVEGKDDKGRVVQEGTILKDWRLHPIARAFYLRRKQMAALTDCEKTYNVFLEGSWKGKTDVSFFNADVEMYMFAYGAKSKAFKEGERKWYAARKEETDDDDEEQAEDDEEQAEDALDETADDKRRREARERKDAKKQKEAAKEAKEKKKKTIVISDSESDQSSKTSAKSSSAKLSSAKEKPPKKKAEAASAAASAAAEGHEASEEDDEEEGRRSSRTRSRKAETTSKKRARSTSSVTSTDDVTSKSSKTSKSTMIAELQAAMASQMALMANMNARIAKLTSQSSSDEEGTTRKKKATKRGRESCKDTTVAKQDEDEDDGNDDTRGTSLVGSSSLVATSELAKKALKSATSSDASTSSKQTQLRLALMFPSSFKRRGPKHLGPKKRLFPSPRPTKKDDSIATIVAPTELPTPTIKSEVLDELEIMKTKVQQLQSQLLLARQDMSPTPPSTPSKVESTSSLAGNQRVVAPSTEECTPVRKKSRRAKDPASDPTQLQAMITTGINSGFYQMMQHLQHQNPQIGMSFGAPSFSSYPQKGMYQQQHYQQHQHSPSQYHEQDCSAQQLVRFQR